MKRFISIVVVIANILLFCFSAVCDSYAAKITKGDINGDTKVNAIDASLINLIVTGKMEETCVADINSDNKINSADVNLLKLIITGKYIVQPEITMDPNILETIDNMSANLLSEINDYEDIEINGPVYYISPNGNDNNDGKTPESAWKTVSKLTKVTLTYGSTILFECGGKYRGKISSQKGITYSSYGKGEKPMIIGSPYDGAKEGTWTETEYPNVYKYSYKIQDDVGLIVYNNGEGYIGKVAVNFTGVYADGNKDTVIRNLLTKDMTFYHDLGGAKIESTSRTAGYVYMYSTEGNPSERFDNLEFNTHDDIIHATSGVTVSNLHIAYGGSHGIAANSCENLKVSHCEISWIGGSVQLYRDNGRYVRYGNAVEIYGSCDGYIVDHCYIHDVYDAAMTHQFSDVSSRPIINNNVTYSNNLVERCVYGVEYFNVVDGAGMEESIMSNILVTGNIFREAGGGFGYAERPDKNARHIQGGWRGISRRSNSKNFVIENNIFDRSVDILVSISSTEESHLPVMRGNTYVQYINGYYGMYGVVYDKYYVYDNSICDVIYDIQNESDANIYGINK